MSYYLLKKDVDIEEVKRRGAEYKEKGDRLGFARYLWSVVDPESTGVYQGPGVCQEGVNTVIGGSGFGFVKDENGEWLEIPHIGGVVIGDNVRIGDNCCIDRGTVENTVIGDGTKIDNLVHIAHNCKIGKNCIICAGVVFCGSVTVEDDVWLAPGTLIKEGITIGKGAKTGLGAVVIEDVSPGALVYGCPAKVKTTDHVLTIKAVIPVDTGADLIFEGRHGSVWVSDEYIREYIPKAGDYFIKVKE